MANKVLIDRAVVQQALEALQTELMGYDGPVPHIDSAISALRAALLEQQAERDALLAALRDLVQLEADGRTEYESAIPHWDAARAAIAKAEKGGGNG